MAGCDPLRDEGISYAARLRHVGIPVTLHLEKEMVHGFLNFFNSAASPDASALVEPILDQAASEIHMAFYNVR
jgi:acetyl esterase